MEARQILERALERYESGRYRWGRGSLHKTRKVQGEVREYICLMGSLQDQPGTSDSHPQAKSLLLNAIHEMDSHSLLLNAIHEMDSHHRNSVAEFNDRVTRAKAMKALRRAIELAPKPVVQASEEELSVSGD